MTFCAPVSQKVRRMLSWTMNGNRLQGAPNTLTTEIYTVRRLLCQRRTKGDTVLQLKYGHTESSLCEGFWWVRKTTYLHWESWTSWCQSSSVWHWTDNSWCKLKICHWWPFDQHVSTLFGGNVEHYPVAKTFNITPYYEGYVDACVIHW